MTFFILNQNKVRFIGIVEIGGIGKTTLAQVCYDQIESKFDYNACFLTISSHDLVSLQVQLLSRLLRKVDIKIPHVSEGANLINGCLKGTKVLIVLDGVNEKKELEYLAGGLDWFGPGSRIIITTKNKDVFSHPNYQNKVKLYDVKPLDYNNSFALFCNHAFGGDGNNSDEKLKDLSEKIVKKIDGHPQALERIGSFLYNKDIDIWREELESIELVENKRLSKILEISFGQLEPDSQKAFLDLTCFFNGKDKGQVREILKSLGYSTPQSELNLLCDRYLIEIKNDTIHIPNLSQAMGREMERKAARRSRIWLRKEAFDIFPQQNKLQYIKGVVLDKSEKQPELKLEGKQFKEMTSLKILEFDNVKLLKRNLEYLPNHLRLLHWDGYPLDTLPQNFEAPYLFGLLLPLSQTTHLWKGIKSFQHLKVIDASDSRTLVETPNLTQVPNLESLILSNCTRLKSIDDSIIRLKYLRLVDLTCCFSLETSSLKCIETVKKNLPKIELRGLERRQSSEGVARQPQSPRVSSGVSTVSLSPQSRSFSSRIMGMFRVRRRGL